MKDLKQILTYPHANHFLIHSFWINFRMYHTCEEHLVPIEFHVRKIFTNAFEKLEFKRQPCYDVPSLIFRMQQMNGIFAIILC